MTQQLLDVENVLRAMVFHGALKVAERVKSDQFKPGVLKLPRQPPPLLGEVTSMAVKLFPQLLNFFSNPQDLPPIVFNIVGYLDPNMIMPSTPGLSVTPSARRICP